jgi:hypothetical protein
MLEAKQMDRLESLPVPCIANIDNPDTAELMMTVPRTKVTLSKTNAANVSRLCSVQRGQAQIRTVVVIPDCRPGGKTFHRDARIE